MGEAKRKKDRGEVVSADQLAQKRLQQDAKTRYRCPKDCKVEPFNGNIFVLDSATEWKALDTLDPNLIPERKQLAAAVRGGIWIPAIHLTEVGVQNMKRDLPPGAGLGRYYFLAEAGNGQQKTMVWMEVTHVISMVQS